MLVRPRQIHRLRPACEPLEGRSLCTINGLVTIAILGTGTDPVGILAGHVLRGASIVEPGQPGCVDVNGHDTATASVAERWCPGVQILPVVIADARGSARSADIAAGIEYAVAQHADVISCSFATIPLPPGWIFDDGGILAALGGAAAAEVPVVFAAGNDAADIDAFPAYPAALAPATANTVAVAAVDAAGALAPFSNYGANTVALAAPGVDVPVTTRKGGHPAWSGTSFAAPAVAAVEARELMDRPGTSAAGVVAGLRAYAVPTPGTIGTTTLGGAILAPPAPPPAPKAPADPPLVVAPPPAFGPPHVHHRRRHHHPRH